MVCKAMNNDKCEKCEKCMYINENEIYTYEIDIYGDKDSPSKIWSHEKLSPKFINKIAKCAERAEKAWREAEFGDIVCHGDCDDHLGTCVHAAEISYGNYHRKGYLINHSHHFQVIVNKKYLEKYCDTTNITEKELKWTLMTINTSSNDGCLSYFYNGVDRFHRWILDEIKKEGGLREWLDKKYEDRYQRLIGWEWWYFCKEVNNPRKHLELIDKYEEIMYKNIPSINWRKVREIESKMHDNNINTIEEYVHKQGYMNNNRYSFEDYGFKIKDIRRTDKKEVLFEFVGNTLDCKCENSIIIKGNKIWSSRIYRYQKDGVEVSDWHGEFISNDEFMQYMTLLIE